MSGSRPFSRASTKHVPTFMHYQAGAAFRSSFAGWAEPYCPLQLTSATASHEWARNAERQAGASGFESDAMPLESV